MREYKFMGKHYYLTGVWVYGDLVRHACAPGYVFIGTKNDGTIQVIPETVGQFTGLHDKSGREIYDGDILQTRTGKKIVEFRDGVFVAHSPKDDLCRFHDYVACDWQNFSIEVIGNIHENQELLEGK